MTKVLAITVLGACFMLPALGMASAQVFNPWFARSYSYAPPEETARPISHPRAHEGRSVAASTSAQIGIDWGGAHPYGLGYRYGATENPPASPTASPLYEHRSVATEAPQYWSGKKIYHEKNRMH